MKRPLIGITFNGENINIFLNQESSKEIGELLKEERKIKLYHPPRKTKNWSPYKGRASKVRKVEIR